MLPWQQKISSYAKQIQVGKFGKVISMEIRPAANMKEVYIPYFEVVRDGQAEEIYPTSEGIFKRDQYGITKIA
jgi:hypothetical protein